MGQSVPLKCVEVWGFFNPLTGFQNQSPSLLELFLKHLPLFCSQLLLLWNACGCTYMAHDDNKRDYL